MPKILHFTISCTAAFSREIQMNQSPHIVVLTATITPAAGMPGTLRSDPAVRLKDYCDAFRFYASLPHRAVDKILVLENSGADLDVFRRIVNEEKVDKKVEYISISSAYDATKGKGYGEFLMLDEGLAKSTLCTSASKIWKITGRLKILNLADLIKTAPSEYEIYCDLRDVPFVGEKLGGNQWMELRLFSFNLLGYDRFFRNRFDADYVLEKPFFETLEGEVRKGNRSVVPRFRVQPILDGFSGHSNLDYSGPKDKAKNILRSVFRRLAPRLWL